jgi:hypothetical protein
VTTVRVLVGTQKGGFVLTSDGRRSDWKVEGPLFGGWEVYHMTGTPGDPDRLYASQSTGWFGQILQRSDDGGSTWQPAGNDFAYEGGGAPTSGTTALPTRGSSPGSGTSSRRRPIPTPSTPASRTPPCSSPPMERKRGRSCRVCAPTPPARAGSPGLEAWPSTRS